jgi:hypothetical protein
LNHIVGAETAYCMQHFALATLHMAQTRRACSLYSQSDVQKTATEMLLVLPEPMAPAPYPDPDPAEIAAAEDPDILALSQSLKDLGIGSAASCLKFAKALEEQGILTMERLKKMPAPQAKRALEIVKMTEFQIDAIMEVIAPVPVPAPVPAPAPAPASAPAPAPAPALDPKVLFPPTALPRPNFIRFAGCCRRSHPRQTRHHRSSEKRRLVSCSGPLDRRPFLRWPPRRRWRVSAVYIARRSDDVMTRLFHDTKLCFLIHLFFSWTPLHYSAQHGHTDVCRLLLENAADVNAKNDE